MEMYIFYIVKNGNRSDAKQSEQLSGKIPPDFVALFRAKKCNGEHGGQVYPTDPCSSSRVLTWMDAGLMPLAHRIQTRQALFIWSVLKTKGNTQLMKVLRELLKHPTDS